MTSGRKNDRLLYKYSPSLWAKELLICLVTTSKPIKYFGNFCKFDAFFQTDRTKKKSQILKKLKNILDKISKASQTFKNL